MPAPFIKGMSGGPVLNARSVVIGFITHGSKPDNYVYDGEFVLLRTVFGNGK